MPFRILPSVERTNTIIIRFCFYRGRYSAVDLRSAAETIICQDRLGTHTHTRTELTNQTCVCVSRRQMRPLRWLLRAMLT